MSVDSVNQQKQAGNCIQKNNNKPKQKKTAKRKTRQTVDINITRTGRKTIKDEKETERERAVLKPVRQRETTLNIT